LVDLKAQYANLKPEIDKAIQMVLEEGTFSGGPYIKQFEEQFAKAHRSKYCTVVSSGTAALHVILLSLEIGPDDEVIMPVNTCFATAEAICHTGATPIFIDCESDYYNLDPQQIEQAITNHTRAILVVHLYGQPAQMQEIIEIAEKYKLILLEDCAQSHLATYDRIPVGNFGKAAGVSFYPTKNLGAFGESGAVLSNCQDVQEKVKMLRDHGSCRKDYHELIGYNYRMDSIQAAILIVKLKYLQEWTETRRRHALTYNTYLKDIKGLILPKEHPLVEHSYHQYVVRLRQRDALKDYLKKYGVSTAIHYPLPCHLQKAFRDLPYKPGSFPVSEQCSREILSLPINEQMKEEDIKYVSDCIRLFFD